MNPEEIAVAQILQNRYPLSVPKYQRSYAWEREDLSDFIRDIHRQYRLKVEGKERKPQFFGGIVTIFEFEPGSAIGQVYRVVDGQQRLTTFTLAIEAVLEAHERVATQAEGMGDTDTARKCRNYAASDRRKFVTYEAVEASELVNVPRLELSRADNDFFIRLLRGEKPAASRASHKRLLDARQMLASQMVAPLLTADGESPGDRLAHLRDLMTVLINDAIAVHIVSEDPGEAYRLFATLNDRGRSLTDGDLLRTWTLGLLEGRTQAQEAVDSAWTFILSRRSTDIDKFLRDYFASVVGERAPSRNLYDRFRERFFSSHESEAVDGGTAAQLAAQMEALKKECETYIQLQSGEWPYENPGTSMWVRDRLKRLVVVLGQETVLPLLLALSRHRSEEEFAEAVQVIERLSFRYLIAGAHAGTLGDAYYRQAALVRETDSGWTVSQLVSDVEPLVARQAPDEVFRAQLKSRSKYSTSPAPKRILKHLLTTLDDYHPWTTRDAAGRLVPSKLSHYDLDAMDVEHIYPQNPKVRVPELDDVKQVLGNLTFWGPGENVRASNDPFHLKKPAYAESKVALTRELALVPEWTREELDARSERLLSLALEIYYVTPVVDALAGGRGWLVRQPEAPSLEETPGRSYHFRTRVRNGGRIGVGDLLVLHRDGAAGSTITGIGHVVDIVRDDEDSVAYFDRFMPVPREHESLGVLGGDEPVDARLQVAPLTGEQVSRLFGQLGIEEATDMPELLDAPPAAPSTNPDDELTERVEGVV